VLTVGMAVDANVLIFERIREEQRKGNSPQKSIDQGYARAFSTILDANITTLIAAVVLYAFGTGPIKGFAVTLSIGIITSMFTAILVSRGIVYLIYGRGKVDKLAI
jgi:preprotein translocase subunit SecD